MCNEAARAVAGAGQPPGQGHRVGQGSILCPLIFAPSAAGAAASTNDDGGVEQGGAQEAKREADGAGEAVDVTAEGTQKPASGAEEP